MQFLKQSTSVTIMFGPFVDKTDGITLKTDATTITDIDHTTTGIFLSKAGAAAAIRHQTVTASVADAYGMMKVTLDTTDTDTVGMLDILFAKAATYLPVHKTFMVLEEAVYDMLFANGAVALATATALATVDGIVDTIAIDVAGLDGAAMRGTDSAALASVCTAARLAELDAANLPTDIDTLVSRIGVPANIDTGGATIADNLKKLADDNGGADFDATTHSLKILADDMYVFGFKLNELGYLIIRASTAQAGGNNTITFDAGASASNDWYKGQVVVIVSGTNKGQVKKIISYNGTTKVATVDSNWVTNPGVTSEFAILAQYLLDSALASALVTHDTKLVAVGVIADTIASYLDTEVAAILAKTNNLPEAQKG